MNPVATAVLLIGFQNDCFSCDGALYDVIEEPARLTRVVKNTVRLLDCLHDSGVTFVAAPIHFTRDYAELTAPVGILKTIKERGAFRVGSHGSQMIDELKPFADQITVVPGRRGLNAFSNTSLDVELRQHGIEHVVLAGAVTSICIDSTARSAYERGYRVSVLSDCTSARTAFEQSFYCEHIFPLYAKVETHSTFLAALEL